MLVVDEDPSTALRLQQAMGPEGFASVASACTWAQAHSELERLPSVALVEACFSDGSDCRDFVRAALRLSKPPVLIGMSGRAERALIAELSLSGIDAYLERPVEPGQLLGCVAELRDDLMLYRRIAQKLVGRVGLKEVQWYMRGLMSRDALDRTGGCRTAAAAILGIDRRYVARLAQEFRASTFAPD